MDNDIKGIEFNFAKIKDMTKHLIKVIGVGGGGGNAVKTLYNKGVQNVGMAVCNTDSQALSQSPVPIKVQLGDKGLGVGGNPELGRVYAEESLDEINQLFDDDTQMVFITAGMGGGTGTGAAPVIARAARERGILTIGVVTLPFLFEMSGRVNKALEGVEVLKKEVDSLLVINNERLLEIYDDCQTTLSDAFAHVDDILSTATKSIAEIITTNGIVNRDFKDVEAVMKDGGNAVMSIGYGSGENRLLKAMNEALNSPLLNKVDMTKIRRLLYVIYTSNETPVTVTETTEINQFMDGLSPNMEVLWGLYPDDTLGDQVKVAIVATGFDKEIEMEAVNDTARKSSIEELKRFYYPSKDSQVSNPKRSTSAEPAQEDIHADEEHYDDEAVEITEEDTYSDDEKTEKKCNWFKWLKEKIIACINEEE